MEKILRNIIEGVSNNYGTAFFNTITLKLHEAIGSDFTFIARLDVDAYVSRTISLVADGELAENMEYSLKDTPCAEVTDDGICLYPKEICKYFPDDQLLVDMGIEGYVGTPLKDSNGEILGLTVALYKHPIQNIEFVQTVFQIFSGRIAAEIERSEYEANLEKIVAQRTEHLEDAMQSLKRTQALLIQQEKLASLGGVVAGVAHEINTPLGIAKTGHSLHVDTLNKIKKSFNDKTLTASAMQEYLDLSKEVEDTITINLERAIDLVQNFKHAAVDRVDSRILKHNLRELIERIIISLAAEFSRNQIKCHVDISKSIFITTSGSDLSQVISNLIMNASVHAFEGRSDRQITISARESGQSLDLWVSDNGVGVAESIRDTVFEPFVTTKRHEGSTGLGMNIVFNQVTSKLKGSIKLELPVAGGSQWRMTFPLELSSDTDEVETNIAEDKAG
ncbi:MAG: HAMP domain-containing sensor histidine kinase [Bermanella sp.]